MLKNIILAILIVTCFPNFSCKKSGGGSTTYTVTEFKTNKPIQGASVSFYTVGDFDLNCVCWREQFQTTKQTNQNGQCILGDGEFTLAPTRIAVDKANYYSDGSNATPLPTNYELESVGQIQLHLVRINSYTGQIYMDITVTSEKPNSSGLAKFPAPVDSVLMFTGFGGETNKISYNIYDSTSTKVIFSSAQIPLQVLSSGTASLNINY